jgi:DNA adenine methylase
VSYPGGKGGAGVAQIIINQQPPHSHYVEPFLGSGAVMRAKRPAFWNTAIDLDADPIAAFGEPAGFTVINGDGIEWLADANLRADALVYCDPPYLLKVRSSQRRLYRCEFDEEDHWALLRIVKRLKCMVQISGYWSSLYAKRLEGWRVVRFQGMTRGGLREECLWMNYAEPIALHDYSHLGSGFRERERIKRKTLRWTKRLNSLPHLERLAIYSEMASTIAVPDVGAGRIDAFGDSCRPTTLISAMEDLRDRTTPETEMLQ